ncbi:50S ribosomal protein L44e [Nanoarchaeota archaeon]
MKIPKATRRHCPFCKKHTAQKVAQAKKRGRNASRPLSRFSASRLALRGRRRGAGNKGKYSKPAIASFKRVGKKTSKKTDFRYTCQECQKTHSQKSGIRTKKVELT